MASDSLAHSHTTSRSPIIDTAERFVARVFLPQQLYLPVLLALRLLNMREEEVEEEEVGTVVMVSVLLLLGSNCFPSFSQNREGAGKPVAAQLRVRD